MNAYELADQLQGVISVLNIHHEVDCLFIANECQYMLCQQADRIAELEKQLKPIGNGTIGYLDDVPINDLVHRKSIPLPLPENTWTACGACGQIVTGDSIHTCSPQTKPLSDGEILYEGRGCALEDDCERLEFGRAIEAKVRGDNA